MFRPNTGIDLNDFPALGTPVSSNRGSAPGSLPPQPPSSSILPSNRFANYPSSTSNPNHLQDVLLGNSGPVAGNSTQVDYGVPSSSPLGSFPPVHNAAAAAAAAAAYAGHAASDHHQLAGARGLAPRTFSMDDFPALRSSASSAASPYSNDLAPGSINPKGEPWDYAAARESITELMKRACD
ncbi:hypothetical protein BX666DRAFT_859962 [Dichotomocladium elegans]|nr:hypothetical protein BX666DRAFT_859962 [Dichotomocladium elegans]